MIKSQTRTVVLAELEPGVVEGFEDAVDVVAALGSYLDNRQTRPDCLLDPGNVLVIVRVINSRENGSEKPVGISHAAGQRCAQSAMDYRSVIIPVGLGGKQPEVVVTLAELVDQVLA